MKEKGSVENIHPETAMPFWEEELCWFLLSIHTGIPGLA
jgi:hypothetical protein